MGYTTRQPNALTRAGDQSEVATQRLALRNTPQPESGTRASAAETVPFSRAEQLQAPSVEQVGREWNCSLEVRFH